MDIVKSKNGVPIRLNDERWFHITQGHNEMVSYYYEVLETISNPDAIYMGNEKELLAVKKLEEEKLIVVVYKEIDNSNGFVITSFLTKRIRQIERREKIWEK